MLEGRGVVKRPDKASQGQILTMSRQNADPMLVTEILGVHPQLLLDDIINGANETIYESVDSLEDFLRDWIEEKESAGVDGDELRKELDQVSGMLKYTRV
jgi:hypothetical protein